VQLADHFDVLLKDTVNLSQFRLDTLDSRETSGLGGPATDVADLRVHQRYMTGLPEVQLGSARGTASGRAGHARHTRVALTRAARSAAPATPPSPEQLPGPRAFAAAPVPSWPPSW